MAWIESHQSLSRHRKTIRASGLLKCDRHKLIGHLHELWWWGLDNVGPAGELSGMENYEIGMAADWDGNPDAFVDALIQAGFIDRREDGLWLHNWPVYTGRQITRQDRTCRSYRMWRQQVLERDDYQCQQCDGDATGLHAHHIKAFARYPDLRFNVDNGITLCRDCHIAIHGLRTVNERKEPTQWRG